MSTIPMYLDFYNNSIQTINSKQYDTSRNIKITCTDRGKKVYLDLNKVSVVIRYKKNDGNNIFEDADILEDGTVLMKITPQMVASVGRSRFDVIVFNQSGLKVDTLSQVASFEDLGVDILSTMIGYINVAPTAVNHKEVESTSEYNALMLGLAQRAVTESRLIELEKTLSDNETIRQNKETEREAVYKQAEEVVSKLDDVNNAISIANTASSNCEQAIANANTATGRANTAAEGCEKVISDYSSTFVILDENGQVPASQLGNVHQILYGYEEPTDDIGKDGDIYMMIIE